MHLTAHDSSTFSWPGMPHTLRSTVFGELVFALQRTYVRGLLRRSGEHLREHGPTLCAHLEQRVEQDELFRAPLACQAALVDAADHGHADPGWLAAMVGLSLLARGDHAEWSVELLTPARVRLGAWSSPLVTSLQVRGAELRVDDTWVHTRDEAALAAAGFTKLPSFVWNEHEVTLVPAELSALSPLPVADRAAQAEAAALVPVIAETFALLEAHAPAYVRWVLDALHTLVPLRRVGKDHRSGSYNNVIGVVAVGTPVDAATLAELLVHETSHQYLLALRTAYRLSNQRDAAAYFSPFPRAPRPIEGILVGYQAFANIERLELALLQSEREDVARAARDWLRTWQPELARCERMLEQSAGLTPIGKSLWQPLARARASVHATFAHEAVA